jgi:hypothetical protein
MAAFVASFLRLNRILWKYGYPPNFQGIVAQMLLATAGRGVVIELAPFAMYDKGHCVMRALQIYQGFVLNRRPCSFSSCKVKMISP